LQKNLGQISDVLTIDAHGTGRTDIIVCGGHGKGGELRACVEGFLIQTIVEGPQLHGSPLLLSLKERPNEEFHSHLIFSYSAANETQIMSIKGEEFEPVTIPDFVETEQTIHGFLSVKRF
jgi:hypothetical protein